MPILPNRRVSVKKTSVISPTQLNDRAMRNELIAGLRRVATEIRQEFRETTKTWKQQPDFGGPRSEKLSTAGGKVSVEVSTDDWLYTLLNNGAEPHIISATEKPALIFNSDFEPKTQPGVIDSFAGYSGGKTMKKLEVDHPGFEARDFDKTIAKEIGPRFRQEMEESMRRAAAKSENSMDKLTDNSRVTPVQSRSAKVAAAATGAAIGYIAGGNITGSGS